MSMPKGERKGKYGSRGSLFKPKGSRFYYAVWMCNGIRHSVSTHETNLREAKIRLAEMVENFRRDGGGEIQALQSVKEHLQRKSQKALPVSEAFAVYEKDSSHGVTAETTARSYRSRVSALTKWIEENHERVKYVDDIDLALAQAFMDFVDEGKTEKTYNDYLAILSQVWDVLVKRQHASVNPWRSIPRKERATHTKKEFSAEQLNAIFNATSGEMRTLFYVGIYTGLRLKDCVLLKWENVDMAARFLSVTPAKTARRGKGNRGTDSKTIDIPMLPPLFNKLNETPAKKRKGFVLPECAKVYLRSDKTFANRLLSVFKRAGIATTSKTEEMERAGLRAATDFGFHSLRHTFVSIAHRCGIAMQIVQRVVGHTNVAMTEHYTHIERAQLVSAMSAFNVPGFSGENTSSAPAQVEGTEAPVLIEAGTAKGKLETFKELVDGMTPEELAEAVRYINAKAD